MTIASHELKGKIQSLKQPFVIMKPRFAGKRNIGTSLSTANNDNNQSQGSSKRMKPNDDDGKMEVDEIGGYEVAGVVTSKILFDRYPKSIMR